MDNNQQGTHNSNFQFDSNGAWQRLEAYSENERIGQWREISPQNQIDMLRNLLTSYPFQEIWISIWHQLSHEERSSLFSSVPYLVFRLFLNAPAAAASLTELDEFIAYWGGNEVGGRSSFLQCLQKSTGVNEDTWLKLWQALDNVDGVGLFHLFPDAVRRRIWEQLRSEGRHLSFVRSLILSNRNSFVQLWPLRPLWPLLDHGHQVEIWEELGLNNGDDIHQYTRLILLENLGLQSRKSFVQGLDNETRTSFFTVLEEAIADFSRIQDSITINGQEFSPWRILQIAQNLWRLLPEENRINFWRSNLAQNNPAYLFSIASNNERTIFLRDVTIQQLVQILSRMRPSGLMDDHSEVVLNIWHDLDATRRIAIWYELNLEERIRLFRFGQNRENNRPLQYAIWTSLSETERREFFEAIGLPHQLELLNTLIHELNFSEVNELILTLDISTRLRLLLGIHILGSGEEQNIASMQPGLSRLMGTISADVLSQMRHHIISDWSFIPHIADMALGNLDARTLEAVGYSEAEDLRSYIASLYAELLNDIWNQSNLDADYIRPLFQYLQPEQRGNLLLALSPENLISVVNIMNEDEWRLIADDMSNERRRTLFIRTINDSYINEDQEPGIERNRHEVIWNLTERQEQAQILLSNDVNSSFREHQWRQASNELRQGWLDELSTNSGARLLLLLPSELRNEYVQSLSDDHLQSYSDNLSLLPRLEFFSSLTPDNQSRLWRVMNPHNQVALLFGINMLRRQFSNGVPSINTRDIVNLERLRSFVTQDELENTFWRKLDLRQQSRLLQVYAEGIHFSAIDRQILDLVNGEQQNDSLESARVYFSQMLNGFWNLSENQRVEDQLELLTPLDTYDHIPILLNIETLSPAHWERLLEHIPSMLRARSLSFSLLSDIYIALSNDLRNTLLDSLTLREQIDLIIQISRNRNLFNRAWNHIVSLNQDIDIGTNLWNELIDRIEEGTGQPAIEESRHIRLTRIINFIIALPSERSIFIWASFTSEQQDELRNVGRTRLYSVDPDTFGDVQLELRPNEQIQLLSEMRQQDRNKWWEHLGLDGQRTFFRNLAERTENMVQARSYQIRFLHLLSREHAIEHWEWLDHQQEFITSLNSEQVLTFLNLFATAFHALPENSQNEREDISRQFASALSLLSEQQITEISSAWFRDIQTVQTSFENEENSQRSRFETLFSWDEFTNNLHDNNHPSIIELYFTEIYYRLPSQEQHRYFFNDPNNLNNLDTSQQLDILLDPRTSQETFQRYWREIFALDQHYAYFSESISIDRQTRLLTRISQDPMMLSRLVNSLSINQFANLIIQLVNTDPALINKCLNQISGKRRVTLFNYLTASQQLDILLDPRISQEDFQRYWQEIFASGQHDAYFSEPISIDRQISLLTRVSQAPMLLDRLGASLSINQLTDLMNQLVKTDPALLNKCLNQISEERRTAVLNHWVQNMGLPEQVRLIHLLDSENQIRFWQARPAADQAQFLQELVSARTGRAMNRRLVTQLLQINSPSYQAQVLAHLSHRDSANVLFTSSSAERSRDIWLAYSFPNQIETILNAERNQPRDLLNELEPLQQFVALPLLLNSRPLFSQSMIVTQQVSLLNRLYNPLTGIPNQAISAWQGLIAFNHFSVLSSEELMPEVRELISANLTATQHEQIRFFRNLQFLRLELTQLNSFLSQLQHLLHTSTTLSDHTEERESEGLSLGRDLSSTMRRISAYLERITPQLSEQDFEELKREIGEHSENRLEFWQRRVDPILSKLSSEIRAQTDYLPLIGIEQQVMIFNTLFNPSPQQNNQQSISEIERVIPVWQSLTAENHSNVLSHPLLMPEVAEQLRDNLTPNELEPLELYNSLQTLRYGLSLTSDRLNSINSFATLRTEAHIEFGNAVSSSLENITRDLRHLNLQPSENVLSIIRRNVTGYSAISRQGIREARLLGQFQINYRQQVIQIHDRINQALNNLSPSENSQNLKQELTSFLARLKDEVNSSREQTTADSIRRMGNNLEARQIEHQHLLQRVEQHQQSMQETPSQQDVQMAPPQSAEQVPQSAAAGPAQPLGNSNEHVQENLINPQSTPAQEHRGIGNRWRSFRNRFLKGRFRRNPDTNIVFIENNNAEVFKNMGMSQYGEMGKMPLTSIIFKYIPKENDSLVGEKPDTKASRNFIVITETEIVEHSDKPLDLYASSAQNIEGHINKDGYHDIAEIHHDLNTLNTDRVPRDIELAIQTRFSSCAKQAKIRLPIIQPNSQTLVDSEGGKASPFYISERHTLLLELSPSKRKIDKEIDVIEIPIKLWELISGKTITDTLERIKEKKEVRVPSFTLREENIISLLKARRNSIPAESLKADKPTITRRKTL